MASLIQVRDLLALRGRMEAAQISQTLNTPQPVSYTHLTLPTILLV